MIPIDILVTVFVFLHLNFWQKKPVEDGFCWNVAVEGDCVLISKWLKNYEHSKILFSMYDKHCKILFRMYDKHGRILFRMYDKHGNV